MRHTRFGFALLFGIAVFSLLPTGVRADSGDYEINQDCIVGGCFTGDSPGYPITISTSGRYVLTTNLAPPGNTSTSTIAIVATGVDLDLNGHTINGGGSCLGTPVTTCSGALGLRGVEISASGSAITHVHDGIIRGFASGGIVSFGTASGTLIDHLVITEINGSGISIDAASAETNTQILDSTIARNSGSGISISNNFNSRLQVENCVVAGNKAQGIVGGPGSTFSNNRINSNGGVGLLCITAAICAVGRNSLYSNNGGGANPQWAIPTVRDMGGNVCLDDGTCP